MTFGVLLKTIIFTLLIYYIGKFIFKVVFSVYVVRKRFKEQMQQFQEQAGGAYQQQNQHQQSSSTTGQTRIHVKKETPKTTLQEEGEYIDYEEVK